MSNAIVSTIGLCADALGAGLLGFDLVRLQHRLRKDAAERESTLLSMAEDYGGVAAWAETIKKDARWIANHEYSRYHAEDETSYNARNIGERAQELGECVNGLAEHVSGITTYLGEVAKADVSTAALSIRYSVAGLVLLFVGFLLQTAGTNV